MSTKTTAPEPDPATGSPSITAPASSVQEPCTTLVRITALKVRIGDLLCARGATVCVIKSQADQLVAMNQAIILGVK